WPAVSRTTCAGRDNSGTLHYRRRCPEFLAFRRRYRSGANGRSRHNGSDFAFNVLSRSAHLQSIHCFGCAVRRGTTARVYRPFPTLPRQTSSGRNACNVFPTCGLHDYVISAAPPGMGAALDRAALGIRADHETASSPVLDVLADRFLIGDVIPTRLEIVLILGDCTFRRL